MLNKSLLYICLAAFSLLVIGCSSSPTSEPTKASQAKPSYGRYHMKDDRYPDDAPDVSKVRNATPKYEPYSRQGNRDYTVLGKDYRVLDTGEGFTEQGIASWYGSKFHGHLTSNGETYDMYTMSAAHKNLPLPSYVKVTNLENNKQIIARVNDRGPFHEGRVIDLSYAGAYHLGMLAKGSARVKLETIYIPSSSSRAIADVSGNEIHYIQVAASQDKLRINMLAQRLEKEYGVSSRITTANGFHRLQLGPIGQISLANKLLDKLQANGFPQSYIVPG